MNKPRSFAEAPVGTPLTITMGGITWTGSKVEPNLWVTGPIEYTDAQLTDLPRSHPGVTARMTEKE